MIIKGPQKVSGTVKVSGAKNSVLPIMCAALLGKGTITLNNVPNLNDVRVMSRIICKLGRKVEAKENSLVFSNMEEYSYGTDLPEYTGDIRYSVLLLGSLLATIKKLKLPMPGGCNFSARPIDIHLDGLAELNANIQEAEDFIEAKTKKLVGNKISLRFPSVGATENLIIASALAEGKSTIYNAAREPEIEDLINFLNILGAKIKFIDPSTIEIEGVEELSSQDVVYDIMPDRIEAATYAVLGALSAENELIIDNFIIEHNLNFLNILQKTGVKFKIINSKTLQVFKSPLLKGIDIETDVFPDLATDIQPLLAVLLTQANGQSTIIDNIYPSRFQYTQYLNDMGGDIVSIENGILIKGKTALHGKEVYSTDLRGGAAMVLAGIIASGDTKINNTYQIFRGYSNLAIKLEMMGINLSNNEKSLLNV